MHSGLLTQRITVKREVRTSDGAGGAAVSLRTVATVRARVEAVRAAERVQSDRVQVLRRTCLPSANRTHSRSGQKTVSCGKTPNLTCRLCRPRMTWCSG